MGWEGESWWIERDTYCTHSLAKGLAVLQLFARTVVLRAMTAEMSVWKRILIDGDLNV